MWEVSVLFQSYKRESGVSGQVEEEKAERCPDAAAQVFTFQRAENAAEGRAKIKQDKKVHRGSKTIHIDLFSYQEKNRPHLSL